MPYSSYKRFFDQSRELLCIVSLDGFFVDVNDAFTRVLGHPKSSLIGKSIRDLIAPQDIEKTLQEFKRIKHGESSTHFENRFNSSSGEYVTLSWSTSIDPESGQVVASARDVTEQSNQARKIQQIEAALNKTFILAETDAKGVITRVNDNFCDISGYTKGELIGQTHRLINSGIHPEAFFSEMWQTIRQKKIWAGDITNRNKNGELYYVKTTIAPMINYEGDIQGFMAIRQDITDQIKHEIKLAKTLKILNETSSSAKIGGWELDVNSGLLTWTDETFRILEVEKRDGYHPLLAEGISLFVDEHIHIIDDAVTRCMTKGEPYSLELKAKTSKGNQFWVYTTGNANYVDGEIKTISGTIQDINARKTAEKKFNLEKQKSIQTAKLASLGELAASMAHEINNPLGIISGYSELLRSRAELADAHEKLDVILKSCKRISHIVNNLKRFSREEGERKQGPIVLSQVIKEAIMLTQPRLKRAMVQLTFESDSPLAILGNDIEMEQVFLNLINNAADAIQDLPVRWINIELTDTSGLIQVRITDSGHGIAADVVENIFSPFYTTKKVGEGTGLGLSIVADMLKDHNASIQYDMAHANTSFVLHFTPYQEA